ITDWNAQAERTFGWSRAEAIGQILADLVIPARYRDGHLQGLQNHLATGSGPLLNRRVEISALHRDGHEFPIELAVSAIEWNDKPQYAAFVRDVTDRNRAQHEIAQTLDELARSNLELEQSSYELREREQQLSSIYNTVADAIFRLVASPEGDFRFHSVNEAFL